MRSVCLTQWPNPEVFLSHANARTNEYGRNLAVERYLAGHKVRDIAGQLGISRTTVYKWIARYALEGLADRSSRPHRSPRQVPLEVELAPASEMSCAAAPSSRRTRTTQSIAELARSRGAVGLPDR